MKRILAVVCLALCIFGLVNLGPVGSASAQPAPAAPVREPTENPFCGFDPSTVPWELPNCANETIFDFTCIFNCNSTYKNEVSDTWHIACISYGHALDAHAAAIEAAQNALDACINAGNPPVVCIAAFSLAVQNADAVLEASYIDNSVNVVSGTLWALARCRSCLAGCCDE